MELNVSNRIFFEEVSHSYMLDDDRLLMGVTELMKKHGLSADYSGIPEATLKKAAEEGTAIHRELQNYENGEAVFASELIDEYKKLGLKFVYSEYPVSDYELVASAIDMVYAGKKGAILVDIKTTQKLHRRPLEWQLGIYAYLFKRQNPEIPVDACYCLWIDKKKRTILGLVPIDPVSEAEVLALLDAERKGIIYVDEGDIPDACLVLNDDELSLYIQNQTTIADLKAQIKAIEDALKAADQKVLDYMLANNIETMAAPGGEFKIKKAYSRTTIDSAALKKAYPAIAEKYSKTTEVSASITFKAK